MGDSILFGGGGVTLYECPLLIGMEKKISRESKKEQVILISQRSHKGHTMVAHSHMFKTEEEQQRECCTCCVER